MIALEEPTPQPPPFGGGPPARVVPVNPPQMGQFQPVGPGQPGVGPGVDLNREMTDSDMRTKMMQDILQGSPSPPGFKPY